ncbi:MAG: hypothetical protein OQK82_04855 [Candidatus Pacearchaeota archaeon]|nr:hypothetical protein [Candidatus Pacearchaeota archaeon]
MKEDKNKMTENTLEYERNAKNKLDALIDVEEKSFGSLTNLETKMEGDFLYAKAEFSRKVKNYAVDNNCASLPLEREMNYWETISNYFDYLEKTKNIVARPPTPEGFDEANVSNNPAIKKMRQLLTDTEKVYGPITDKRLSIEEDGYLYLLIAHGGKVSEFRADNIKDTSPQVRHNTEWDSIPVADLMLSYYDVSIV